jgi:ATP-dependent RNA helicase RhlE
MERGNIDFGGLEVLVLDEADRMLDMGFIRDVRRIIRALPRRRQTLFFSATMPDEIRRLSKEILRDPINVEVAPRRSAPAHGVRQSLLPVAAGRKRELMTHLVEKEARGQTLVFTRTKHGANKLARHLERLGHGVAVLHGNRSQAQRTKALDAFKKKRARVMVATDIAGRGIDVEGLRRPDRPHGARRRHRRRHLAHGPGGPAARPGDRSVDWAGHRKPDDPGIRA